VLISEELFWQIKTYKVFRAIEMFTLLILILLSTKFGYKLEVKSFQWVDLSNPCFLFKGTVYLRKDSISALAISI